MGRPAKPTSLKLLHGDRSDRINRDAPVPSEGDVRPPEWLDGVGLEVWQQLAPDLIERGVMTAWDVEAFAMACDQVRVYREARAHVEADGMKVPGARGGEVRHPLIQVMRDAQASFNSIAARFGLTPSDRSRLTVWSDSPAGGPERLLS